MSASVTDHAENVQDDKPVVVVTGSSGLIGQPVCLQLANRGYRVFAFDRVGLPEPPKSHENVSDIECDTTSSQSVRQAFQAVKERAGDKIASVVHLAAYYDFSGDDSPLYEEVTVNGTDRLLNALEDFQLEQFVFSSTMLVHKPCAVGDRISEDDPLLAKWPYPASKIETEKLIAQGHPSVRSVMLRIAGVYTDFGRQPTLVQQIKRIYEKDFQSYFYPGDTDAGQSAVYLDDAVDAIVRTVENRSKIPAKEAILIGEADPPSYEELQDEIAKQLHGKEWAIINVPKSLAKVGATVMDAVAGGESFIKPFMIDMAEDHYALDISKAKQLLGWAPQHHLLEHVRVIVDRLKKDPESWYANNGLK